MEGKGKEGNFWSKKFRGVGKERKGREGKGKEWNGKEGTGWI